jgi:hypothetical protein
MQSSSGVTVLDKRWGGCVTDGNHPGAEEGAIMELLVVAIVAIAGVGLFRFWRTRSAN